MAHRAPGSSLRRTGPRRHQAVKAKAHGENDPATTKSRLSDRSTESSTQPSTSAVIFEPGTGEIFTGAIERQTELVLEQMKLCVETAGSSPDNVLKVNVYVTSFAI